MVLERNEGSLHLTILVRRKLEMTKGRWVSLLEIKYWTAGWLLLEWLVTWLVNAYGEELVADQEELELRRKKKESVQRSLTNMEISEWKWSKAKEPHFGFRCRNRSNVRRQVRSTQKCWGFNSFSPTVIMKMAWLYYLSTWMTFWSPLIAKKVYKALQRYLDNTDLVTVKHFLGYKIFYEAWMYGWCI